MGLDRRAATRIIIQRNGADGICGTADDQPFEDLASLDAVKFVGDAALERLVDYAHAHGWVVDSASVEYGLDEDAALSAPAAGSEPSLRR